MSNPNVTALMPIWGYNHSIPSVIKHRLVDVINGHLDVNNTFEIDLNQVLTANYIDLHKEKGRIRTNSYSLPSSKRNGCR